MSWSGWRSVSVLFNEPKLLKQRARVAAVGDYNGFSALQRAEIAETWGLQFGAWLKGCVSVLFNEPKLLKSA